MWFKSNPEKKALYREIRDAEKELAKKKKLLRKLMGQFMREHDLSNARKLITQANLLAFDIDRDIRLVDSLIDKYNEMYS